MRTVLEGTGEGRTMRIWDVHPGYLDRQRLLGEHRELHGVVSIHVNHKRGYSAHPETRRWSDYLGALAVRHGLLVAEMHLRGYRHSSPVTVSPDPSRWPEYLDPPARQFELLRGKYGGDSRGRIPLPRHPQQVWAQHKYSVLARSQELYRELGRRAARAKRKDVPAFLEELTELLRQPPTPGGLHNALEHMWGYVVGYASKSERLAAHRDAAVMLQVIQRLSIEHTVVFLLHSTALSEMMFWLGGYSASDCDPSRVGHASG